MESEPEAQRQGLWIRVQSSAMESGREAQFQELGKKINWRPQPKPFAWAAGIAGKGISGISLNLLTVRQVWLGRVEELR